MNIRIATPSKKPTVITVMANQTIGEGKEIFYKKMVIQFIINGNL